MWASVALAVLMCSTIIYAQNIALNRPTTCTPKLGNSARAVDGSPNTCMTSNNEYSGSLSDEYLLISLGVGAHVQRIVVSGDSLLSMDIDLINSTGGVLECPEGGIAFDGFRTYGAVCNPNFEARYVRVLGFFFGTVCEVSVEGTAGAIGQAPDANVGALSFTAEGGVAGDSVLYVPQQTGPPWDRGFDVDSDFGFTLQFFARRTANGSDMIVANQGECDSSMGGSGRCVAVGWGADDRVLFRASTVFDDNVDLISCQTFPALNEWHRWTFTGYRRTRAIYYDATLVATDQLDYDMDVYSGTALVLGQLAFPAPGLADPAAFQGQLDMVRWYNRAMPASEVALTATYVAFPDQLVLELKFDDVSNLFVDTSGKANNATLPATNTAVQWVSGPSLYAFTDSAPPSCGGSDGSSGSSLTGGAIAGIVVGALVGSLLLCFVVACCIRECNKPLAWRTRMTGTNSNSSHMAGTGTGTGAGRPGVRPGIMPVTTVPVPTAGVYYQPQMQMPHAQPGYAVAARPLPMAGQPYPPQPGFAGGPTPGYAYPPQQQYPQGYPPQQQPYYPPPATNPNAAGGAANLPVAAMYYQPTAGQGQGQAVAMQALPALPADAQAPPSYEAYEASQSPYPTKSL